MGLIFLYIQIYFSIKKTTIINEFLSEKVQSIIIVSLKIII